MIWNINKGVLGNINKNTRLNFFLSLLLTLENNITDFIFTCIQLLYSSAFWHSYSESQSSVIKKTLSSVKNRPTGTPILDCRTFNASFFKNRRADFWRFPYVTYFTKCRQKNRYESTKTTINFIKQLKGRKKKVYILIKYQAFL